MFNRARSKQPGSCLTGNRSAAPDSSGCRNSGSVEDSFLILVDLLLSQPSKIIQEGWLDGYPPIRESSELEI